MNNEYDKIREYLKNTHPDVLESYEEWDEEQKVIKKKEEILALKAKSRRMIGFYKENAENDIEREAFPSVEQTNRFGLNYQKLDMIQYIESLPISREVRGRYTCNYIKKNHPDKICHEKGVYYTDGEYIIHSIVLLHIKLFDISLPQKFVDKAVRANYDPAHAVKESIWGQSRLGYRGELVAVEMLQTRVSSKRWAGHSRIISEALALYKKERSEQE